MAKRPRPPGLFEAAAVILCALAMVAAVDVMVLDTAPANVPVGSLLAFDPSPQPDRIMPINVMAVLDQDPHHAHCFLTARMIHQQTGSLLVTKSTPQGITVHWIGGETAPGAQSCGRQADLSMQPADFIQLSRSANRFY